MAMFVRSTRHPVLSLTCVTRFGTLSILLPVLMILSQAGCAPSDGRQAIAGRVTLDGEPIAEGSINFRPIDGTVGPSGGAKVVAGEFFVPADKGLMVGTYQVSVLCMRETGRTIQDPQMGPIPELVPVQFAQLPPKATVVEGDNEYQCDLTSVRRR